MPKNPQHLHAIGLSPNPSKHLYVESPFDSHNYPTVAITALPESITPLKLSRLQQHLKMHFFAAKLAHSKSEMLGQPSNPWFLGRTPAVRNPSVPIPISK